MMKTLEGKVCQVMGPVVDIRFHDGLPALYTAIEIELNHQKLVVEVAQHIGDDIDSVYFNGSNGWFSSRYKSNGDESIYFSPRWQRNIG